MPREPRWCPKSERPDFSSLGFVSQNNFHNEGRGLFSESFVSDNELSKIDVDYYKEDDSFWFVYTLYYLNLRVFKGYNYHQIENTLQTLDPFTDWINENLRVFKGYNYHNNPNYLEPLENTLQNLQPITDWINDFQNRISELSKDKLYNKLKSKTSDIKIYYQSDYKKQMLIKSLIDIPKEFVNSLINLTKLVSEKFEKFDKTDKTDKTIIDKELIYAYISKYILESKDSRVSDKIDAIYSDLFPLYIGTNPDAIVRVRKNDRVYFKDGFMVPAMRVHYDDADKVEQVFVSDIGILNSSGQMIHSVQTENISSSFKIWNKSPIPNLRPEDDKTTIFSLFKCYAVSGDIIFFPISMFPNYVKYANNLVWNTEYRLYISTELLDVTIKGYKMVVDENGRHIEKYYHSNLLEYDFTESIQISHTKDVAEVKEKYNKLLSGTSIDDLLNKDIDAFAAEIKDLLSEYRKFKELSDNYSLEDYFKDQNIPEEQRIILL